MNDAPYPMAITIRPAVPKDADGIARTYVESAEYHARLYPERYSVPGVETISARYREGRQHLPDAEEGITLVAELRGEIVGFIDARLDQSPDPMHQEMIYCRIAELAVSSRCQNQGIGGRLLQAAEDWGAGRVWGLHLSNITQTPTPPSSISGAWAIAWRPSQRSSVSSLAVWSTRHSTLDTVQQNQRLSLPWARHSAILMAITS